MYAKWMASVDTNTDAILFVENYNIFYIPDVGIEEKKIYPISQTEVVIPEVIFHGIPDWIYEGELGLEMGENSANIFKETCKNLFKFSFNLIH